ncbi:hypothetical protein B0H10DRAFT_1117302 [Mycena sp. CBHHK59/15]|nr:hypothetical protein B0H10DRAFT_1117302 [Mycena sp. CBHHK59/15]
MAMHGDFVSAHLLGSLRTLGLQRLTIVDDISGTLAAGLVSFLVRSSCPLTHLTLQDISIRNDELISVLSLTPQLTHLTLSRTGSRPDNALMHGSGKPNLLQHLMFLSVALIDTPECGPAAVRDMLQSRAPRSAHCQVLPFGPHAARAPCHRRRRGAHVLHLR